MIRELWFRIFPGNWRYRLIDLLLKDDEKFLLATSIDLRLYSLQEFKNGKNFSDNIRKDEEDLRNIRRYLTTKEYI